jgi:hypothetical protein
MEMIQMTQNLILSYCQVVNPACPTATSKSSMSEDESNTINKIRKIKE